MSIAWYIQRFRTFSIPEILFRFHQRARTHILDKQIYKRSSKSNYSLPESSIIQNKNASFLYPIFEKNIDIFKPIDWHLDIQSEKRFPRKFSHQINIRSDEYGSAKHVWEINRLLFLTYIALQYKETNDSDFLDLFVFHVTSWVQENPYLEGVNWYSNIEINIRLINFYFCYQILNADLLRQTNSKFSEFYEKIWQPCIEKHAEFSFKHPSLFSSANNHLISEYAGLFVAACAFDIKQKEKKLIYAKKGLEREIIKQNSLEGVNREEAAEYIQFINDFFLIAAIVGQNTNHNFSENYFKQLHKIAHYLNQIIDQNGNYPMYGDGDDGFVLLPDAHKHYNNFLSQLSSFAVLFKDASLKRENAIWDNKNELLFGEKGNAIFNSLESLGTPNRSSFFEKSGHFIFRKKFDNKETYLHFDAAPLGFLSIAAHGHADALSFILHVEGVPFFIDSGTFTYHTHKEWRKYFVGTLAHNTIRINQKDQATLAGPTMWLNHYDCQITSVGENFVEASHNGYKSEGVSHTRKIEFHPEEDSFTITDSLKSKKPFLAEIPFHLHPKIMVHTIGASFLLKSENSRSVQIFTDANLNYEIKEGEINPITGWYSEHFGEKFKSKTLYAKKTCSGNETFVTKIKIQ